MPVCLEALLFLCPYVLLFSALAARYGVSPYVSWVTRTSVRGQPRSGLLCILCKLLLLMFSALSGLHRRYIFCSSVLLSFCSYVLRVSGSLRRQPLCFFGHADVSPWPAVQRPFVYLM